MGSDPPTWTPAAEWQGYRRFRAYDFPISAEASLRDTALSRRDSNWRSTANYRMWSSASSTAPSSGLHSCLSKSACSCCLALSASVTNSRRVRNANLQTSQYAVFGVLPINLTILSFRSGTTTSLQGIDMESTAFRGCCGQKLSCVITVTAMPFAAHLACGGFCFALFENLDCV